MVDIIAVKIRVGESKLVAYVRGPDASGTPVTQAIDVTWRRKDNPHVPERGWAMAAKAEFETAIQPPLVLSPL